MAADRAAARAPGRTSHRTVRAPGRAASANRNAREVLAAHHDEATSELFGIKQLCEDFRISARALRFYEDKGLLSPRRVNGARVYTRRDRARLALILRSKAIGVSLAEMKHYLDLYGAHGEGRVQQLKYVLQRTDAAIGELQKRSAQIESTLAELRLINHTVRAHLGGKT